LIGTCKLSGAMILSNQNKCKDYKED